MGSYGSYWFIWVHMGSHWFILVHICIYWFLMLITPRPPRFGIVLWAQGVTSCWPPSKQTDVERMDFIGRCSCFLHDNEILLCSIFHSWFFFFILVFLVWLIIEFAIISMISAYHWFSFSAQNSLLAGCTGWSSSALAWISWREWHLGWAQWRTQTGIGIKNQNDIEW